jgi:hypothetical protein
MKKLQTPNIKKDRELDCFLKEQNKRILRETKREGEIFNRSASKQKLFEIKKSPNLFFYK